MKIALALLLSALATLADAQPLKKVVLFGQPSVNNDAIWMALEHGYFKEQGLEVEYRVFPSGTTAFQTFRTGQGDIVMTGDLPSVQYFFNNPGQYQTFVAIERDAKGYVVIARKDIKSPRTSPARRSRRAWARPARGSSRSTCRRTASIRKVFR